MSCTFSQPVPPPSPLMLADRLLTIAAETDRAGYTDVAQRLLGLMYDVLDAPAPVQ